MMYPDFKDKTGGTKRRIIIIPFDNEVTKKDPKILDSLTTPNAKSYLLNLGLNGIRRIINNGYKLSFSEAIQEATNKYHSDNDTVTNYLSNSPNIHSETTDNIYGAYIEYCNDLDLHPLKKPTFSKKLIALGYSIKNTNKMGKKIKVYIKNN